MTPEQALNALSSGWEQRDADAIGRLFAADGRYEDPLFDGVKVGPQAIRDACAEALADLTEVSIPVRQLLASDRVVYAEGEFQSRLTSGERLDFGLAMIVEVEGGKISRFAEYFDTAPLGL
jgi:ketosteroid isomerase-like protein